MKYRVVINGKNIVIQKKGWFFWYNTGSVLHWSKEGFKSLNTAINFVIRNIKPSNTV